MQGAPFLDRPLAVDPPHWGPRESLLFIDPEGLVIGG
jgi:hypothetical protein